MSLQFRSAPRSLRKATLTACLLAVSCSGASQQAWERAEALDTREAYEKFIAAYPKDKQVAEAGRRLQRLSKPAPSVAQSKPAVLPQVVPDSSPTVEAPAVPKRLALSCDEPGCKAFDSVKLSLAALGFDFVAAPFADPKGVLAIVTNFTPLSDLYVEGQDDPTRVPYQPWSNSEADPRVHRCYNGARLKVTLGLAMPPSRPVVRIVSYEDTPLKKTHKCLKLQEVEKPKIWPKDIMRAVLELLTAIYGRSEVGKTLHAAFLLDFGPRDVGSAANSSLIGKVWTANDLLSGEIMRFRPEVGPGEDEPGPNEPGEIKEGLILLVELLGLSEGGLVLERNCNRWLAGLLQEKGFRPKNSVQQLHLALSLRPRFQTTARWEQEPPLDDLLSVLSAGPASCKSYALASLKQSLYSQWCNSPASHDTILRLVDSSDRDIRRAAAFAMAGCGGESAIAWARQAFTKETKDSFLLSEAALLLCKEGGMQDVELLMAAHERAPDQSGIEDALARLTGRSPSSDSFQGSKPLAGWPKWKRWWRNLSEAQRSGLRGDTSVRCYSDRDIRRPCPYQPPYHKSPQ